MFYSLLPKFQVRREGISLYSLRKSDEGADTDLMYDFCLPHSVSVASHYEPHVIKIVVT